MECLENDALALAFQGPSNNVYQYIMQYTDDQNACCCNDELPVVELDLICGVFEVDMGYKYNM